MKSYKNSTLGHDLNISVTETAEEFDILAGKVGACVEEAISNVIYRGWNATFRENFVDALEKQTGIARRLDDKAMAKATPRKSDGKIADIYESAGSYYAFVQAQTSTTPKDHQSLAEKVAASIAFDPKPSARTSKPGKELVAAADAIIAKGAETVAKVIAKGECRTYDMGGSAKTLEMANAVAAEL